MDEERREVRQTLREWRELVKSPGWGRLSKIAAAQLAMRQAEVFRSPLDSMDKVPMQEFMKGEGSGIELFMKLPLIEIERLEAELENMEETENGE